MDNSIMGTRVEIYERGKYSYFASVLCAGAIPREGEYINIQGKTWRVVHVAWAIDDSRSILTSKLRANIDVEAVL